MKILKIELQNLNSLKSETPLVIDFEQAQFKDIGLYAITGSTGAGKTTILDAITIGLYHQVPRFNKSNIKAGLADVVSYGANEALSRITFESDQQRYEAQWALRISSKTGKPLQKPVESVRLKNLSTDKILAEKKTNVQDKIIEITQLTYDQFLRSVMLAQGEFAAFLSANAKDKGKLLEQITGEEIYKKIGNTISERLFEEKKTLDYLKAKINTEDLLTEAERNALEVEKQALKQQITSTEKHVLYHKTIQEWFTKQNELSRQEKFLNTDLTQLHALKHDAVANLNHLQRHEHAFKFKPNLLNLERIDLELEQCHTSIKNIEQQSIQLQTELKTSKTNVETYSKAYLDTEGLFNTWLPKLDLITTLDAQITHQEKSGQDLDQRITGINSEILNLTKREKERTLKTTSKALLLEEVQDKLLKKKSVKTFEQHYSDWNQNLTTRKLITEQLKENHNEIKVLKTQISKEEEHRLLLQKKQTDFSLKVKEESEAINNVKKALLTQSLDDLIKQNSEAERDITTWEKILNYVQEFENHAKVSLQQEQTLAILLGEIKALDVELTQVFTSKNQLENSIRESEKIVELTQIVEQFAEERKKLEKDKPCSLCGSLSHPYIESYTVPELNEEKETLKRKQSQYKSVLEKESLLKQQRGIQNTKIDVLDKEKIETTKASQLISSELKRAYIGQDTLTLKYIDQQIERSKDVHNKLQKQLSEHQNLIRKKEQLEKEYEHTYKTQIEFNQNLALLNQKIASNQQQKQALENRKQELQSNIFTREELLNKSLSPLNIQLPTVENTAYFLNRLKGSIELYHSLLKQEEELIQTIKEIKLESGLEHDALKKYDTQNAHLLKELKTNKEQLVVNKKKRADILPESIRIDQKRTELHTAKTSAKASLDQALEKATTIEKNVVAIQQELKSIIHQKDTLLTSKCDLDNTFKDRIESSIFDTLNEIKEALLSDELVLKFKTIKEEIQTKETQLNALKQQIETQKNTLKNKKSFDITEEDNSKILHENSDYIQTFNQQLGAITSKFALDKQITDRNENVVKEIKQQELVYNKWSQLLSLIGGSKHAFNTYVQRLTLKNLIQLANIHLYKLNKRYSLKMEDTYKPNEELNFKLVDHYQTDVTRYVDTSSGGEKFLISLSLALGLSDLSNHNVQIKSLFIDEGFGTLDNSTLEVVLTTLETLQAQGKMIGIISHVENLKNRIPTQIQVLKKSNGVSTISIS